MLHATELLRAGTGGSADATCMQIYKLESQYIDKANPRGNALKGV